MVNVGHFPQLTSYSLFPANSIRTKHTTSHHQSRVHSVLIFGNSIIFFFVCFGVTFDSLRSSSGPSVVTGFTRFLRLKLSQLKPQRRDRISNRISWFWKKKNAIHRRDFFFLNLTARVHDAHTHSRKKVEALDTWRTGRRPNTDWLRHGDGELLTPPPASFFTLGAVAKWAEKVKKTFLLFSFSLNPEVSHNRQDRQLNQEPFNCKSSSWIQIRRHFPSIMWVSGKGGGENVLTDFFTQIKWQNSLHSRRAL